MAKDTSQLDIETALRDPKAFFAATERRCCASSAVAGNKARAVAAMGT